MTSPTNKFATISIVVRARKFTICHWRHQGDVSKRTHWSVWGRLTMIIELITILRKSKNEAEK